MSEKTDIQWTDHTFNPWIGCVEVSAECANCYARILAGRYGWAQWGKNEPRYKTSAGNWRKPLAWNRAAERTGVRKRVFCASLADVGEAGVIPEAWTSELWNLIRQCRQLDWLLVTKRPENLLKILPADYPELPIWFGVTVGTVKSRERLDHLRRSRARVNFVSAEPLLDDLSELDFSGVDWLITGGESGFTNKIRRTDPAHFDNLLAVAQNRRIPVFFKQTGTVLAKEMKLRDSSGGTLEELPAKWQIREYPTTPVAARLTVG